MDRPKPVSQPTKPINVFYVWYTELCRRLNLTPAHCVKPAKPKCQTVLDFIADKLKIEEWSPLFGALKQDTSLHVIAVRSRIANCSFLHDVDTEDKAKSVKRKYGCIFMAYTVKLLVKSLSSCLKNSQVLTYLELQALPIADYLEPLLQALKKNKTLKTLSLPHCKIQDSGCCLVSTYLRSVPNIEVLNLTACDLTSTSGEYLAKLVKCQQINRYCESWHSSLRYERPDTSGMRGIKRLTLDSNPEFGDEGLAYILDQLEDDLWIKALDLQRCNITEDLANRIVDVVQYNQALEVVDLRQNSLLATTVAHIVQIVKQRQPEPEFMWGSTVQSLTWSSVHSNSSIRSYTVHKSRSAPMNPSSSRTWNETVRKSKTVELLRNRSTSVDNRILQLNNKLQKEIEKRKQIEKRNAELQSQLTQMHNGVRKVEMVKHKPPLPMKPAKQKRKQETQVYQLLERMLSKGEPLDENTEEDMLDYLTFSKEVPGKFKADVVDSVTASQVSLYKYMEELKRGK